MPGPSNWRCLGTHVTGSDREDMYSETYQALKNHFGTAEISTPVKGKT